MIRLLQRNARVATAGADRNTPLHLAAMKGFTNVARKLIDNGAYVAAENKEGHNPLYLAVQRDHCDFAVLMVNNMEPVRYMHVRSLRGILFIIHCSLLAHSLVPRRSEGRGERTPGTHYLRMRLISEISRKIGYFSNLPCNDDV